MDLTSKIKEAPHTIQTLKWMYSIMLKAREMDLLEQDYTSRGEAFFHVSGGGHESSIALAQYLKPEDWLHCHYRDKALMLARGISPRMFLMSLFNKGGSHSHGRQMNAHMSAPELNILSMGGPVGNAPLQAVGVANVIKQQKGNAIVLCGLGEGTTQESEVPEAFIHAMRNELPILFLIHDNSFAISTDTKGKTLFAMKEKEFDSFVSIPIHRVDGRQPSTVLKACAPIVESIRESSMPRILIMSVERLDNHTNADDQSRYRTEKEIHRIKAHSDPIQHLREELIAQGESAEELESLRKSIRKELEALAREVQETEEPKPMFHASRTLPDMLKNPKLEYRGMEAQKSHTMLDALRDVLDAQLAKDAQVTLFGQDIEDPKGDVFGVTRGLSTKYPGRVVNSPLSESLIVGVSVGEALAGRRPVGFFQFADFFPLGFNQIYAELGSMFWRTGGSWEAPVILMVSSGAYKPGLGPFHSASMEAYAAHVPGIDVLMPSTAADAAGLLNMAFESKRPTVFFYPKNLLNNKADATSSDVSKHFIPIGVARKVQEGSSLSFIAYGNTVSLCLRAARTLKEQKGITADVIDLRSIMPWDKETAIRSAEKTGRVLIVYEDNLSLGFGAEVAAHIAEHTSQVSIRRIARADTFLPCNFGNQIEILPSYKTVLSAAVEMLGGSIQWTQDVSQEKDNYLLEAIGSSPSDESITVMEWYCKVGEVISEGQLLAELEADKASLEFKSPVGGILKNILVEEGETVDIGTPIASVALKEARTSYKPITRETPGTPHITLQAPQKTQSTKKDRIASPGIIAVTGVQGSRIIKNEELIKEFPDWTAEDIEKRTGIATRHWIGEGQDALSLAVDACEKLFEKTNTGLGDIDAIFCSTGTPLYHTPSMATLIQYELNKKHATKYRSIAYDINAACSGYLYALYDAYAFLERHPDKKALVITTEVLSDRLDLSDRSTAPLFADAATATLVCGSNLNADARAIMYLPVLSAQGEAAEYLKVPSHKDDPIVMAGGKIFSEAVKNMSELLIEACTQAGLTVHDLDYVVPHQANQRILAAIGKKLKIDQKKIFSNVRHSGNTSSNTIPLCLIPLFDSVDARKYIGLVAFGGGFTFGGMIIRSL